MQIFTPAFLVASCVMGLGIAIDVAIATVARFRDSSMTFSTWTFPVAVAHILLPAFGYYGWWLLGSKFDLLGILLGLSAFAMITLFVYEAFCDWIDVSPLISLSKLTDQLFQSLGGKDNARIMIVLAVSMDALWSGPAKAAQAESGAWTASQVGVSFVIAGLVVALVSELSLLVALRLRKISFRSNRSLSIYLVVGKYFEAVILFGFGILSLWNSFSAIIGLGSLTNAIALSSLIMAVVWMKYWADLIDTQLSELEEGVTAS